MPAYLDSFCAAQNDCMLPAVAIGGYQGISQGAVSGDRTTNLQGTVNLTQVRGAHTLRGGVDARLAQRQRGLGGNPSGQLSFTNEFTRQASDTSQLTPSNLGLSLAAFMLGIPSNSQATIQPTSNLRNHFFAAYGQDSWRLQNLTVNMGLRVEWENGIAEDNGELIVDFDPNATLAISDLAEAAYARAPIPQLAPADFRVRGGSIYATDPGQDGKVWRPQTMLMPRVSAVYKLGEKTVLKGGYGLYYDTLNAADYGQNNVGLQRHDDQHEQHGLRPDVPARQSRMRDSSASPIRSRCAPTAPASTSRPGRRSASTRSPDRRTTPSRTRTTSTRASSAGGSASSVSWRGTSRWKWPTTAPTRTGSRSASARTTCRSSTGFRAA